MTLEELAECTVAALDGGSIGGSPQILPGAAAWLVGETPDPSGMTDSEIFDAHNALWEESFGIDVDDFLVLRSEADAIAVSEIGEPPGIGEMVGDEWFVVRDTELMRLWNERFPESAQRFCDLVAGTSREPG